MTGMLQLGQKWHAVLLFARDDKPCRRAGDVALFRADVPVVVVRAGLFAYDRVSPQRRYFRRGAWRLWQAK